MKTFSKREFLKTGMMGTGGILCSRNAFSFFSIPLTKYAKEATFYTQTPAGVRCLLCPNLCQIVEKADGNCHTRVNRKNKLYTLSYGNPCGVNVDPIEKKPLFHFLPGTTAYSIGVAGCNFHCLNCQNWQISQTNPLKVQSYDMLPDEVVDECIAHNCRSIAYTYTEPTTFYEYMYETAGLAHSKGIKNLYISNGYINKEPLKKLSKVIDAANIDLKSFNDLIYQKLNSGRLQPVLNTLLTLKDEGVWIEITNLVIPGWTDDFDMVKGMCNWLVSNGFANNPLHFSQFYPTYRLTDQPKTPASTLKKCRDIAISSGLHYVYIGNVYVQDSEDTFCPQCHRKLIHRNGYSVSLINFEKNKCKGCGNVIAGVW